MKVETLHESIHAKMHVNNTLPPLNVSVLVKVEDQWIKARRKAWVSGGVSDIEFILEDGAELTIKRGKISWIYP